MALIVQTAIARVKARGSIRSGLKHWLEARLTSIALIPLGLWFIIAAVGLVGAPYDEVRAWLATPFNTTMMLLTVIVTFWHTYLGVQVIIEDYVHHEGLKLTALIANNFACAALGLACVVATLKVSFGS